MLDQKKPVNTSDFNLTEGRTIPVPTEDSFNRNWFEKYAHIADSNIQVGDPATYSVGSDAYAEVVTEVVRFKEGKRAGHIKYIRLSDGDKYLAYPSKCGKHSTPLIDDTEGRVCIYCWLEKHKAVRFSEAANTHWINVRVGSQNPHQDPSF